MIDKTESQLAQDLVITLKDQKADICLSAVVKVLESLIIGISDDKTSAINMVKNVSEHLIDQLNKKKDDEFGYLEKSAPGDIHPKIGDT